MRGMVVGEGGRSSGVLLYSASGMQTSIIVTFKPLLIKGIISVWHTIKN